MAKLPEPQRLNQLSDEDEAKRQEIVAIRMGKAMKAFNEEGALPVVTIGVVSFQPHHRHLPNGTPITVYNCDEMTIGDVRDFLKMVVRMLDTAVAVTGDVQQKDGEILMVPRPGLN